MRKSIPILLVLIFTYTFVTRFIEIDNTEKAGSPLPYPCATQSEMPRPQENFYPCSSFEQINSSYLREIKPIFEQKCLMCHGIAPREPLYAIIPPTSWLVERDQLKAKEEINMLWDFPFRGEKGAENQKEALKEIEEVVEEDSMPPMIYKIMHWRSQLDRTERDKVLDWVKSSLTLLNEPPPESLPTLPQESMPTLIESAPMAETQPEANQPGTLADQEAPAEVEVQVDTEIELETNDTAPTQATPPPPPPPDGSENDFL